jgi:L-serine dehydratase
MISVFDLFKIGIGPSSSHTVGPMRAAFSFLTGLDEKNRLTETSRVKVELYGSLALTGHGHGTQKAVLLGLSGEEPETVDPDKIPQILEKIYEDQSIFLLGKRRVRFVEDEDLVFNVQTRLPFHSNAMRFAAEDASGTELEAQIYYSIGGGFVVTEHEAGENDPGDEEDALPYLFRTGDEMLELGYRHGLSIAEMTLENEKTRQDEEAIYEGLRKIWKVMEACIDYGCRTEGTLPGSLKLKRRAPQMYQNLLRDQEKALRDPMTAMDWVSLWALAASEENASGGRIVTAPTNGAAGIIPAVLRYYIRFHGNTDDERGIFTFLLTAAAIGSLYKRNASISGAEVGCQGEVGVACSMAAAGLTAVLGGTNEQIENAAEIGMEHNLGLTCDPVGGLVQVPCIERNAMGAIKAINASRLALRGDGAHFVSLDKVVETMLQTGADMQDKYKETSKGGLAVSVVEC